jgi:hypothetical protein
MVRAISMTAVFMLAAALCTLGPIGLSYADNLPKGQVHLVADQQVTREVDIYRSGTFPSFRSKMINLCRDLRTDYNAPPEAGKSSMEIYKSKTGPGTTEYRSEYRESNRFASPGDEARTLQLCDRLEDSVPSHERVNSEVHIYRETTVPKK